MFYFHLLIILYVLDYVIGLSHKSSEDASMAGARGGGGLVVFLHCIEEVEASPQGSYQSWKLFFIFSRL